MHSVASSSSPQATPRPPLHLRYRPFICQPRINCNPRPRRPDRRSRTKALGPVYACVCPAESFMHDRIVGTRPQRVAFIIGRQPTGIIMPTRVVTLSERSEREDGRIAGQCVHVRMSIIMLCVCVCLSTRVR